MTDDHIRDDSVEYFKSPNPQNNTNSVNKHPKNSKSNALMNTSLIKKSNEKQKQTSNLPNSISSSSSIDSKAPNSSDTNKQSHLTKLVNLAKQKEEIVIRKGSASFGFSWQEVKDFYDESNDYIIQHIVDKVDQQSPAYLAGLRQNDMITHIDKDLVCGKTHAELLKSIMQQNGVIKLRVVNLSETKIKMSNNRFLKRSIPFLSNLKSKEPINSESLDLASGQLKENYKQNDNISHSYRKNSLGKSTVPPNRHKSSLLRKLSQKSSSQSKSKLPQTDLEQEIVVKIEDNFDFEDTQPCTSSKCEQNRTPIENIKSVTSSSINTMASSNLDIETSYQKSLTKPVRPSLTNPIAYIQYLKSIFMSSKIFNHKKERKVND